ncbi:hypothetical protein FA15DRAFT_732966 [Coprinopsis marcescibilis]|uniref:Uncharacterized protein n=1 Tax=Coprinopsis marcescibilis TaxID=230819 RepID=A0A5C3KD55_COPMA|nr:hypothetical protein FA15DRAFT_732966 [Coprinopsis marcescibilis]
MSTSIPPLLSLVQPLSTNLLPSRRKAPLSHSGTENVPPIGSTGCDLSKLKGLNRLWVTLIRDGLGVRPYPKRKTVQLFRQHQSPPCPNQLEEERLAAATQASCEEYQWWKKKHDKKINKALLKLEGLVWSFSDSVGKLRGACNELRQFVSTECLEDDDNSDGEDSDIQVGDDGADGTIADLSGAPDSNHITVTELTTEDSAKRQSDDYARLSDGEEGCHWVDQMDDEQFEKEFGARYRREEFMYDEDNATCKFDAFVPAPAIITTFIIESRAHPSRTSPTFLYFLGCQATTWSKCAGNEY